MPSLVWQIPTQTSSKYLLKLYVRGIFVKFMCVVDVFVTNVGVWEPSLKEMICQQTY